MLVKPEEVGLSSPRLARIREHFQRYIDAGQLAGTVTLLARRGRLAYLEAQGHLEIERQRPMSADAVFRINVKALDQGIVRFKIQMTSTNLTEPVIKMEATRIYSDAPETKPSH